MPWMRRLPRSDSLCPRTMRRRPMPWQAERRWRSSRRFASPSTRWPRAWDRCHSSASARCCAPPNCTPPRPRPARHICWTYGCGSEAPAEADLATWLPLAERIAAAAALGPVAALHRLQNALRVLELSCAACISSADGWLPGFAASNWRRGPRDRVGRAPSINRRSDFASCWVRSPPPMRFSDPCRAAPRRASCCARRATPRFKFRPESPPSG